MNCVADCSAATSVTAFINKVSEYYSKLFYQCMNSKIIRVRTLARSSGLWSSCLSPLCQASTFRCSQGSMLLPIGGIHMLVNKDTYRLRVLVRSTKLEFDSQATTKIELVHACTVYNITNILIR